MAPRRVFLVGLPEAAAARFEGALATALDWLVDIPIAKETEMLLQELIDDALLQGAQVLLNGIEESSFEGEAAVTLITSATPTLLAMQTGIFAPILSVMRTADLDEALAASAACPYGLTASVFGPEKEARAVASKLRVGNVLINDIVVPTADPRVAFGGRGRSGFGVTRGVEGLLAMTTPRTIQTQRGRSRRAYEPTGDGHVEFFAGLAQMLHGGWSKRWLGLLRFMRAARKLK
jgi:aldehyde dehydrogenase (NAD+)